MFALQLLLAVILDGLRRLIGIQPTRAELEYSARSEALRLALHDDLVEIHSGHRTFLHHHDQARARHGL